MGYGCYLTYLTGGWRSRPNLEVSLRSIDSPVPRSDDRARDAHKANCGFNNLPWKGVEGFDDVSHDARTGLSSMLRRLNMPHQLGPKLGQETTFPITKKTCRQNAVKISQKAATLDGRPQTIAQAKNSDKPKIVVLLVQSFWRHWQYGLQSFGYLEAGNS